MPVYKKQMNFEDVNDDYKQFLEKFKSKKTTDDCYTPENIYNAIADWACKKYQFEKSSIVRPFWPGGDYESFDYPENCVVLDNPPFSILSKILRFYCQHGVRFFLFSPELTLFNAQEQKLTYIIADTQITYANGAKVPTGFVTNLGTLENVVETSCELKGIVEKINRENIKGTKKTVQKLIYPDCIVTAGRMKYLVAHGVDFALKRSESLGISKIGGVNIFGGGYMISERAAAERAAAERAAAKQIKLSPSEIEIQKHIGEL